MLDHAHHQPVVAPPVFEILELVKQVACGFASNAGKVGLVSCDAPYTVAGGAGLHAFAHRVVLSLRRCLQRKTP